MASIKLLKKLFIIALLSLVLFSCDEEEQLTPEQIERNEMLKVENALRDNLWGFKDLKVTVQYESKAIPLLANVADENGMVKPGTYDSYDIFGNSTRQQYYTYQFLRDDINVDTLGTKIYNRIGGYFVINTEEIRINLENTNAIRFVYDYNASDGMFYFTADEARSEKLVEVANDIIVRSIINQTPGDVADAVVNKLLNSEKVAEAIEGFLYDLIHGKIEEVAESPEEIAEKLAILIINKLKEIDWETVLYDKILELLQKLEIQDPEGTATELAQRIEAKILATITQDSIYDIIYPILLDFENETIPVLSTQIAEKVYELIRQTLSEEKLYDKIYPLWNEFSQIDSTVIESVSDTLSYAIVGHFMDTSNLAQKLLPFVTKVDATPVIKLGSLSQEIIDSTLIPLVDTINSFFPTLGLEPNWNTIKPVITAGLTTIKASIGTATLEEFSEDLAETIISLLDVAIREALEKAIFKLQEIPSEQAAFVIASWITSLLDFAEQPLTDFIEDKLDAILAQFDAGKIALEISQVIYNTITNALSEENLYQLILPVLEAVNDVNKERVAVILTKILLDSGIIKDNITEEQAITALTEVLTTLIGNVNPDEATQLLVDGILGADILDNVDGTILSLVLEIKIYQLLISVGTDINAIEQIELQIIKK